MLLAGLLALGPVQALARTAPPKTIEMNERHEIEALSCDHITTDTVDVGDTFDFYVDFTAKDCKVVIDSVNFLFWADQDYNGDEALPKFIITKELEKANGIVDNTTMRIMTSSKYHIRVQPKNPAQNNIMVNYEIFYYKVQPDGTRSAVKENEMQCLRLGVKKK